MNKEEITALAREYAEEYTKKKYPNVPGHVRERIVEGRLEHMEDFIPWLLRRYCLVEKEAVRKEYESVKDTPDECNYEEMGATWDGGLISADFITRDISADRKMLLNPFSPTSERRWNHDAR